MSILRVALFIFVLAAGGAQAAEESVADSQLAYAYEVFLSHDPAGPDSAEIWLKLANLRLRQLRYAEAREAYRQVEELGAREAGGELALAGSLGVGLSLSGEERYEEAVAELTAAIERAGDSPVRGNLVSVYRELANIGLQTHDYDAVLEYGEVARTAYRRLGKWEDEALMLLVVGIAHGEQGNRTAAADALKQSHELYEMRGDRDEPDYQARVARVTRIARGYGIETGAWE